MTTKGLFVTSQSHTVLEFNDASGDFNSGGQIGSVSAASSAFSQRIGMQFKRVGNILPLDNPNLVVLLAGVSAHFR